MKELTDLIERERMLFERLKDSVVQQKLAVIDRDLETMNEALLKTERLAFEIENIDRKRQEMFDDLKRSLDLPQNAHLADVVNRLEGEERDILLDSLSRFLKTVNDLIAELQGMKDMLDFERSYFDFLKSLFVGNDRGVYSRRGDYRNVNTGGSFDSRW